MQFKFEADFKLKYYAAKKGPHTGMEVYIHIIFYILRYKNDENVYDYIYKMNVYLHTSGLQILTFYLFTTQFI